MPFFRPERALSQLLRHDAFSPLFARSSFHSPLSRLFELHHPHPHQLSSPFSAPFFTVFEEARNGHERSHLAQPQQQKAVGEQQSGAAEQSGQPSTSASNGSQAHEVTRTDRSQEWMDRRSARRHRGHRHSHQHHPLSLFSPFASPFPSLFNSFAPFNAFAPLSAALPSMPDMTVDMFSTPQAYTVHAAVPGLEKKDIKITVEDGVLTIEAERRETTQHRQPISNAATTSTPSTTSTTSSSDADSTAASSSSSSTTSTSQPATEVKAAEGQGANTTETETSQTAPASSQSGSTPAAATSSSAVEANEGEDGGVDFHHVESFYGRVERSVQLPEDAKVEELTAKYENGVIKIDIPRLQENNRKRGRRIEIQ